MAEYQLILIRSILAYMVLLLVARVLGKKQISQLTFFDYVVGITIGSIAASMSVDQGIKITNGLVSIIVWGVLPILTSLVAMKSFLFSKAVDGSPTVLIEGGKILEKNLKKSKLTAGELMLNIREKNVFKLADVELAILETNGKVSVMKKSEMEPITPKVLNLQMETEKSPHLLIIDGKVLSKTLSKSGYTEEWLLGEVQKQGAKDISEVFAAQVDSKGNLYVDHFDDKIKQNQINQRKLVEVTLKKIEADLKGYALQTQNQQAKQMYNLQAGQLNIMLEKLGPYLKG